MITEAKLEEAKGEEVEAIARASKEIVAAGVRALSAMARDTMPTGVFTSSLAASLLRANVLYLTLIDQGATADLLEAVAADVRESKHRDIGRPVRTAIEALAAAEMRLYAEFEAKGRA